MLYTSLFLFRSTPSIYLAPYLSIAIPFPSGVQLILGTISFDERWNRIFQHLSHMATIITHRTTFGQTYPNYQQMITFWSLFQFITGGYRITDKWPISIPTNKQHYSLILLNLFPLVSFLLFHTFTIIPFFFHYYASSIHIRTKIACGYNHSTIIEIWARKKAKHTNRH